MIPDIKRRIDQIRQGEIPEGYQKKSVGIIPQNWNKSFLGAIIKELSSGVRVSLKTPQRCPILPEKRICCVAFACIPPRSAALMRLASAPFWRIVQHF